MLPSMRSLKSSTNDAFCGKRVSLTILAYQAATIVRRSPLWLMDIDEAEQCGTVPGKSTRNEALKGASKSAGLLTL